jgi:DNA-binding transcriptional regulator YiaG
MDEFRQKIKSLRRKMGWTQEDLARKIDVSLSTVQRWEKRHTRPTRLARRELKSLFKAAGLDSI